MKQTLSAFFVMYAKYRRAEFYVSLPVFLDVLTERERTGERGILKLNHIQDSPRFRYLHTASLQHLTFIHASREIITLTREAV